MPVVSSQRAWSILQVAKGNCSQCGKPREVYTTRCNACQVKKRLSERRRLNQRKYVAGGRGRAPYIPDEE